MTIFTHGLVDNAGIVRFFSVYFVIPEKNTIFALGIIKNHN